MISKKDLLTSLNNIKREDLLNVLKGVPKKPNEDFTKLIVLKTKKMSNPDDVFKKTEETMSTNITPGKNDSEYTECHVPNLGGINDGSGQGYNSGNGGFFQ